MTEPRIAPGKRSDVGSVNWMIAAISGRVTGTGPPNLFLTLGRHRGLFRGWLRFAGKLMPGGKLPRTESELVILRVAHLCESDYEFNHHVRLGRRAGLSADDIAAVRLPLEQGTWSPRQRAILAVVDQLHAERDLEDETWTDLKAHLKDKDCIELLMLTGHYEMLSVFLRTLRVQEDRSSK